MILLTLGSLSKGQVKRRVTKEEPKLMQKIIKVTGMLQFKVVALAKGFL